MALLCIANKIDLTADRDMPTHLLYGVCTVSATTLSWTLCIIVQYCTYQKCIIVCFSFCTLVLYCVSQHINMLQSAFVHTVLFVTTVKIFRIHSLPAKYFVLS